MKKLYPSQLRRTHKKENQTKQFTEIQQKQPIVLDVYEKIKQKELSRIEVRVEEFRP